jgi:UTP--glucose-1-phosphate uridylyltransferase
LSPPFDVFAEKMRAAGLPPVVIEAFRRHHEKLVAGDRGLLSERDLVPVDDLRDLSSLYGYREAGREALARTAVVKLNGGLGTSMGLTKAKSLLPVKRGLSFLDIAAGQVLRLRDAWGVRLPLVLMNSFHTRDDSLAALAGHGDLSLDLPQDFLQHRVPKVRPGDFAPAEWPRDRSHEWCPPGHGDLYAALSTSGLLDEMLTRGYEHAFVSNSDNLGAIVDLDVLGYFADQKLPFLMEVCDRTESDKKGGHLARRKADGLVLREVAQCPKDELTRFQDVATFRYFNTNTLWIHLPALRRVLDERDGILELPLLVNEKPIDPTDVTSPHVFQLETAMGAAISVFDGARAVRVPRERFIPVKTTNDLLGLWSDLYVLDDELRLRPAPSRRVGDVVIDLDREHYRSVGQLEAHFPAGAPSLVRCRRLVVRGDVRFGARCVCRGETTVEQTGAEPRLIPDGEVLG